MHTVPWQFDVPQGFSHASEVVGCWCDSLRDGKCGASLGEYLYSRRGAQVPVDVVRGGGGTASLAGSLHTGAACEVQ